MEKLLEAQKEISKISFVKDTEGQFGKHLSLHEVMGKVLPILNRHELVLTQLVTTKDGQPALTTKIGQLESTMYLLLQNETPQGQGSAITYARRYALTAMLGIVADDDDDGKAAQRVSGKATDRPESSARPTDGQLKAINTTMANKGIPESQRKDLVIAIVGKDSTSMTKLEAAVLLDELTKIDANVLQSMAAGNPF